MARFKETRDKSQQLGKYIRRRCYVSLYLLRLQLSSIYSRHAFTNCLIKSRRPNPGCCLLSWQTGGRVFKFNFKTHSLHVLSALVLRLRIVSCARIYDGNLTIEVKLDFFLCGFYYMLVLV